MNYKIKVAGGCTLLTNENFNNRGKKEIVVSNTEVEQFGFYSEIGNQISLSFWGGEFSGAGVISAFAISEGIKRVKCLGLTMELVSKQKNILTVRFPKNIIKSVINYEDGSIVYEQGINFWVGNSKDSMLKVKELKNTQTAGGFVYQRNGKIYPYVYVKELNTFNLEKACVTASLAMKCLNSKQEEFIQQSGESIRIIEDCDSYLVIARVKLVGQINY